MTNPSETVGTEPSPGADNPPPDVRPADPEGAQPPPAEPPGTAPPPPAAGANPLRRLADKFWLNDRVRELKAAGPLATPRVAELRRRALISTEVAGRLLEPRDPLQHGSADALACDLYRQSIYWALAAHVELRGHQRSEDAELAWLWERSDPELFVRVAGSEAEAEALRHWLVARSFQDFAELEASEQARLARTLRVFAESLVTSVDPLTPELDRLLGRRLVRLAILVAAAAALAFSLPRIVEKIKWRKDLAAGAAWRASSRYPEHGCPSPLQECEGKGPYFFSTHEEDNPWLVLDLGPNARFSRMKLENRMDCCHERAFPLIVEVSTDEKSWREVARRTTEFSVWEPEFSPVTARFVKLRIEKKTNFHLNRVRIGP